MVLTMEFITRLEQRLGRPLSPVERELTGLIVTVMAEIEQMKDEQASWQLCPHPFEARYGRSSVGEYCGKCGRRVK